MKVLFVVSGTKRVAVTRYRVYQYLPYLKQHGLEYEVFSIASDFTTKLAIRSPEFNEIKRFAYYVLLFIERFFRFWFVILNAARFDVIFLQRAAFPFALKRIFKRMNKKIIFDIDDAIFLPDTQKQNMAMKFKTFIKRKELKNTLKIADCVIVENEYIRAYVSRFCSRAYKIPGPIDTERYFVKERMPETYKKEIVLGWIGSPATTDYLHLMDNVFPKILSRFDNVKIVLIGAGNYEFPDRRLIKKNWCYEKEVGELQNFDIGIMPMPDDEWTRGKLGCKMLQYMAVGVPSAVSYTPTNAELIKDGENGFLIKTESQWLEKLSLLIQDEKLRERIGKRGRDTVLEKVSVASAGPVFFKVIKGA